MRFKARALPVCLAIALCGCSSGSSDSATLPPSQEATSDLTAVMTDINDDGNLDVLQVSTETNPVTIVQAMFGDGSGRFVDNTANLPSSTLSVEASQAILTRIQRGAPRARGLEMLQVLESGFPRAFYLIFI